MKLRYALGFIGRGKRRRAADEAVSMLIAKSRSDNRNSGDTISYVITAPYLLDGFRPRAFGRSRKQLFDALRQRIANGLGRHGYPMSVSVKPGYTNDDFCEIIVTSHPSI